MGKNALEKIFTAIIISIISIGLTTVVTRRTLIDGKLDKSEYNIDQAERESKHEKQHNKDRKDMEYVRGKVDEIYLILLNDK